MEKLTVESVQNSIDKIESVKRDDEYAHQLEDELRDLFIRSLVQFDYTADEIKKLSAMVLSTNQIEFARWYA